MIIKPTETVIYKGKRYEQGREYDVPRSVYEAFRVKDIKDKHTTAMTEKQVKTKKL